MPLKPDPTPTGADDDFGKGVWFTFTPPMSGTVSISTCNGYLDSVMQMYNGGCEVLTALPIAAMTTTVRIVLYSPPAFIFLVKLE